MLNYMKAELYRNFNRIYFYAFTASISFFAILSNLLVANQNIGLDKMMLMSIKMLSIPIYIVVMIVDMVTSEENKNLTIKNVLASGLSRNKMYLSKIIVSTILAVISAIIILTIFLVSSMMITGIGENFSSELLRDFTFRILSAVPLWIGTISLCTYIAFLIKNNTLFASIYVILFVSVKQIINILGYLVSDKFFYAKNMLISGQLEILSSDAAVSSTQSLTAVCIGLAYAVVFSILGVIYIRKKDIT